MAFLFANNVNTTLSAAATNTQTTLSLTSTVGIPTTIPSGDYFAMTLNDAATRSVFEVVYVTAVSGSNVTVLRGQEGTTANSWLAGDYIYGALTAGEISDFAFVSGNSSQPFAVAPASASAPQNAPQYGQILANFAQLSDVVNSFNGRQGAVSLTSGDVTNALTYVPANLSGNSGQQFNVANATYSTEAVALGQFTNSLSGTSDTSIIQRPDGVIEQWFEHS